ncbi:MAG: VOC family protein [Chitinophagales bacterium]|nr:VOC family protein [Chitinophagales bacterium]
MKQHLAHLSIVVREYDEAIDYYTKILDFKLIEDTVLSPEKRWVLVAPPGAKECALLLAKAANEEQAKYIGNQTGGRVFLFLFTDDFWSDYKKMLERKVAFISEPKQETHGTVVIFEDLYGNKWDFIQPSNANKVKA